MSYAITIMPDGAREFRRAAIESVPVIEDVTRPTEDEIRAARLEKKRKAAIAALGDKWLMHPDYVFNPRHSFRSDVWRQVPGVLDQIRARAIAGGRL